MPPGEKRSPGKLARLAVHGGPDVAAPFGYAKNGQRFGRGYLELTGARAAAFLSHLTELAAGWEGEEKFPAGPQSRGCG